MSFPACNQQQWLWLDLLLKQMEDDSLSIRITEALGIPNTELPRNKLVDY